MNSRTRQINEATNKYVKKYNERHANIRHFIMNPDEYPDDAQFLTEVSMLFREITEYVQTIGHITGMDIIENARVVDRWIEKRRREKISDLYDSMIFKHLRWRHESLRLDASDDERDAATLRSHRYETCGHTLDQIRLKIEAHGYLLADQYELNNILVFLIEVNDSDLSERLQEIINSLGDPQDN